MNDKVKSGAFREDLFHRLNVIRIALPPLRERKEDIPLLATYFLNMYSEELKSEPKILAPEVEELFRNLIWPGNVLQLQNLCHSLTVLSSAQEVVMSDLPNDLIIQKKGPDLTWNDMLETWASKELVNGEDHILNSTVPIFETKISDYCKVKYAFTLNSATHGCILCIRLFYEISINQIRVVKAITCKKP